MTIDLNAPKNKKFHYAFMILLVGCFIQFGCGGIYSLSDSIFFAPVAKELGVGRADVALMKAIKNLMFIFILPFAGRIVERFNLKIVYTVAVLLMGVSFTLQSTYHSLIQFYIGYAVLGIGASVLIYLAVPFLVNKWFAKNIGFAIGIALVCADIGSLIFNPLAGWLIDGYGWRTGYLVLGLAGLVISLPFTIFVVKSDPSEMGLLKYGDTGEKTAAGKILATAIKGIPLKKAIKSPAFYITIFATFTLTLIANMMIHIPGHVVSLGYKSLVAGTVMSAISIGAIIAKPTWGLVADKVGSGVAIVLAEICAIISSILFLMGISLGFLYAAGFFFGMSYVMITIHPPMVVKRLFGDLEYGSIYSYVVYGNAVAAIVGSYFFGWVYDTFHAYTYSFYVVIGLAIITTILYLWGLSYSKKLEPTWETKVSA